jgi:hypothetical protein
MKDHKKIGIIISILILFSTFINVVYNTGTGMILNEQVPSSLDYNKDLRLVDFRTSSISSDYKTQAFDEVGVAEWSWLSPTGSWIFPEMNLFPNPNVGYQEFEITNLPKGESYLVNVGLLANSTLIIGLKASSEGEDISSGDLDLALYNDQNIKISSSTNSENLDEWIVYTPTQSGNFTVEVIHDDKDSTQEIGFGRLYLSQDRGNNYRRIFMRGKDAITSASYGRTTWAERIQESFYGVYVNVPDRTLGFEGLDMYEMNIYNPEELTVIENELGEPVENCTIGYGKGSIAKSTSAQTFGSDLVISNIPELNGGIIELEAEDGIDWVTTVIQRTADDYVIKWLNSKDQHFVEDSNPSFSFLATDVDQIDPEEFGAFIFDSDDYLVTDEFVWEYELLSTEGTATSGDMMGYFWKINVTASNPISTDGDYYLVLHHATKDDNFHMFDFVIDRADSDTSDPILSEPFSYPSKWHYNELPIVSVEASDVLSGISNVDITYKIYNGSHWSGSITEQMVNTFDDTYSYVFDLRTEFGIAEADYSISYYITAYDNTGRSTIKNNDGAEYSSAIYDSRPVVTITSPITGAAELNSMDIHLKILDILGDELTSYEVNVSIDGQQISTEELVGVGDHILTGIEIHQFVPGTKLLEITVMSLESDMMGSDETYFIIVEEFAASIKWDGISEGQVLTGTVTLDFIITDPDAPVGDNNYSIEIEFLDNESNSYYPNSLTLDGTPGSTTVNGSGTEHEHTVKFATIGIIPNGLYDLIIRVREGELPKDQSSVEIEVNNVGPFPPNVTIDSPSHGTNVSAETFGIQITISDPNYPPEGTNSSNSYQVEIQIDSERVELVSVIGTGQHIISVNLSTSGLEGSSTSTLTVYVQGPNSSTRGSDEISIDLPPLEETTPSTSTNGGEEKPVVDWWVWIIVGVLAVAVIGLIVAMLFRRPKNEISFE